MLQVQEAVHGVTLEECEAALQHHGWSVHTAVNYLKVSPSDGSADLRPAALIGSQLQPRPPPSFFYGLDHMTAAILRVPEGTRAPPSKQPNRLEVRKEEGRRSLGAGGRRGGLLLRGGGVGVASASLSLTWSWCLQVEQLFCLGLRSRSECLKLLETCDWNLEAASSLMLDSYGSAATHR